MVDKTCIDSNIIIDILKGNETAKKLLESKSGEFCITPINIFEVWYGKRKEEMIEEFLDRFNFLPLDKKSAKKAAEIARRLDQEGNPLDVRDVMIGAICITTGASLMTYNKKHFARLEKFGLQLG